MNSLEIQVRFSKSADCGDQVIMDIDEFPNPTAIFFSNSREIVLNKQAADFFSINEKEKFDLDRWEKMNPFLEYEFRKNSTNDSVCDKKVHVINVNGKHEIINYSLKRIQDSSQGKVTFIHFNKVSVKFTAALISSLYSVMEDISRLKPYLNRTGKIMLESILKKYLKKDNSQLLTVDDLVYYEKELRIIQKAYPLLSHREVILCGLLVNDMESQDIASITNRSIDAVFLTIHRINKKLNMVNKKQLVSTLKELINCEGVVEPVLS